MPSETSQHLPVPLTEGSDAASLDLISPTYANREAQEFAVREGLEGPLAEAIRLVPEHFNVVGPLVVSLQDWSEYPQDWVLMIHPRVRRPDRRLPGERRLHRRGSVPRRHRLRPDRHHP